MTTHMKFCSCKACKAGRHRAGAKSTTKRAVRRFRHKAKAAVKKGEEPPTATSIPYTD